VDSRWQRVPGLRQSVTMPEQTLHRRSTASTDGTAGPTSMTRGPAPGGPVRPDPAAASRLRRPSWHDPRLLVGLLLVLGSVVAGALVVRSADDTVPVFVAAHVLSPGDRLSATDVSIAHVRIAGGEGRYLSAAHAVPSDRVLLRAVLPGELLPVSAVGSVTDVALRPVSVPVDAQAVDGLAPGTLVDVWVAARSRERSDAFERPRQLATNAQVSGRSASRGALGSTSAATVRLLLTPDLVPDLIEAVDNDARITLVPVPATQAGDAS
jgi:hypothetical protein